MWKRWRVKQPHTSRKLIVRNITRGAIIADCADVASSSAERRTGLLKHQGLSAGQGLWIVPCEAVHSFGMKFSIDLIYLDRRKRVKKTRSEMRPNRISLCLLADSVLELPVGTLAQTGTQAGDQLELQFVEVRHKARLNS